MWKSPGRTATSGRGGQAGGRVGIIDTIYEVIDMRSFSNLWYWIALAVTWSRTSHNVLGVPWDMITRARRKGGEAETDALAMLGITVNRILYIHRTAGVILVAGVAAVLSTLGILGFYYGLQFGQAVFLIAAPMALVGFLRLRAAQRLERERPSPPLLWRRLAMHRMTIQLVGVIALFVTAMWGMLQNMSVRVL
ncbi:component of SufBCD complex [Frigidibacter sp. MR17.14]|uniref:component of SufBCD complex n=1 Tax=Frigidibacter sp. MR17.14 TaxID=3126509 RepID=UPI003012BAE4